MNTPRKIVVSRYAAPIVRPKTLRHAARTGAVAQPAIRQRWKAEYLEGDRLVHSVDGFITFDEAIAGLIRLMARACESVDEVLDFVAGLFSDLSVRSADVSLSRAIWIAARARHRQHAGVRVHFPDGMEFTGRDKAVIKGPVPEVRPVNAARAKQLLEAALGKSAATKGKADAASSKVKGGVA